MDFNANSWVWCNLKRQISWSQPNTFIRILHTSQGECKYRVLNFQVFPFQTMEGRVWKINSLHHYPRDDLVARLALSVPRWFLCSIHIFLPSFLPSFLLICSEFYLQTKQLNVRWLIQRVNIFLLKDFWSWNRLWRKGPGLHDAVHEWGWWIHLLSNMCLATGFFTPRATWIYISWAYTKR